MTPDVGKGAEQPQNTGRAVRMRDVAELAGVGTMTVSRVLNGTARVTDETSDRVYRAIEALQYTPNPVARALRGSSSNTIGVLLPYLYDPFFATCAHAINSVAQRHGFSVILMTTNEDPKTELAQAQQMVRRQVDGLIVIPAQGSAVHDVPPLASCGALHGLPIVTLDRPLTQARYDGVEVENEIAAAEGTEHLLGHGYQRICFVALSRELHTMRQRHQGYEAAMLRAGMKPEAFFDCATDQIVRTLLQELLARERKPEAIFTANGLTTRYVLEGLEALGARVPEDVALVGFDDFELAELLRSPLTVLRQPTWKLGDAAAELLFERLLAKGPEAEPVRHTRVLPVELVVRGSCGCEMKRSSRSRPHTSRA